MKSPRMRSYQGCLIFLALLSFAVSCTGLKIDRLVRQKHFIWEVRSEHSVVFLVGSVFARREQLAALPPVIEDAFEKSDVMVVESSSLNEDVDKSIAMINRAGSYPRFESLKGNLSERAYLVIGERLDRLGLSINRMEHFKPWFVAMLLAGAEMGKMGLDVEHSMEHFFLTRARDHKKILELESAEEQIALFDSLSPEKQEAFILGTMAELDLIKGKMDNMYKAWTWGDADALDSILAGERAANPYLSGFYHDVFLDRTRRMAAKVEDYLEEDGRYFVIVNAAHLVGEDGIVRLVRKKGFTVNQL